MRLSDEVIKKTYDMIREYHVNHLKQYGVKLPKLADAEGNYTKDALVLVYLAQGYPKTKRVSKNELTQFIRQYYPDTADVQQARHLGAQKGWFIVSGTRGNRHITLESGEYQLITLEKPYPAFKGHRVKETGEWEDLKKQYGYRCATCGSEEGKPHIHWPNTITKLQKAHINPNKPLVAGNIIPQCEKCNRADRNNWVYDERGRVIKLANPNVIKRSDKEVRWRVYKILYEEFNGRNPNE
uniref:HNH endonuclease n=1 Tax=candidate division WOR-3 bacterium TaxID=2052148 RepID=A0A7C6A830_UNCW3